MATETPGGRLPDAQVAYKRARAEWYATAYHGDRDEVTTQRTHMLADDVLAFAADRAALMADFARLQAQLDSAHRMIGECADELTRVEDQYLAMRPLVEALAKITPYSAEDGDVYLCMGCQAESVYYDAFPHDADCRIADAIVMVATWQTPAAPTRLTDAEMTQRIVSVMMQDHPDGEEWHAIPIPPLGPIRNVSPDAAAPTPDGREGGDDGDDA